MQKRSASWLQVLLSTLVDRLGRGWLMNHRAVTQARLLLEPRAQDMNTANVPE